MCENSGTEGKEVILVGCFPEPIAWKCESLRRLDTCATLGNFNLFLQGEKGNQGKTNPCFEIPPIDGRVRLSQLGWEHARVGGSKIGTLQIVGPHPPTTNLNQIWQWK